jgi:hypothetical protein
MFCLLLGSIPAHARDAFSTIAPPGGPEMFLTHGARASPATVDNTFSKMTSSPLAQTQSSRLTRF